jgi:DNA-binding beta-propeller fold protein YncE
MAAPPDGGAVVAVPGALPEAEQIVLSPTGGSAVVIRRNPARAQIVSGLPSSPSVSGEVDFSGYRGAIAAVAVNDDGSSLLLALVDEGNTVVYDYSVASGLNRITAAGAVAALAFAPNGSDAVMADSVGNTVTLFRGIPRSPASILLAGPDDGVRSPAGVSFTPAGDFALVANAGSGSVMRFPVSGGPWASVSCSCAPGTLQALGRGVYRLSDMSDGPVWILDASVSPARIVFAGAPQVVTLENALGKTSNEGKRQ